MKITHFWDVLNVFAAPHALQRLIQGLFFGNFEAYGLPNAYFTTEKHLNMIKTRLISRPLKQNGVRRFFSASHGHYLKTNVAFSIGHKPMMGVFKTISNTRGVEPTSHIISVQDAEKKRRPHFVLMVFFIILKYFSVENRRLGDYMTQNF